MLCLVLEGGQGYRGQARLYQSAASGHQPGGHRANVNTVTVSTWTTATTAASSFLIFFPWCSCGKNILLPGSGGPLVPKNKVKS